MLLRTDGCLKQYMGGLSIKEKAPKETIKETHEDLNRCDIALLNCSIQ